MRLDFNDLPGGGFIDENLPPGPTFLDEEIPMPEPPTGFVGANGGHVSDYPSLRDLETSNVFSGVNHNFNI